MPLDTPITLRFSAGSFVLPVLMLAGAGTAAYAAFFADLDAGDRIVPGAVGILGGAFFATYVAWMLTHRVTADERGIESRSVLGRSYLAWSDLGSVGAQAITRTEHSSLRGGGLPRSRQVRAGTNWVLQGRGGVSVTVRDNLVPKAGLEAVLQRARTVARAIED